MILEETIEGASSGLADLDPVDSGSWVGVTGFSEGTQQVVYNEWRVNLPGKIRHPAIRNISPGNALIVSTRTVRDTKNAWIVDLDGQVLSHFYAGDAIADVVVTKDFIAVTYFDESLGATNVESGRVAVFDREGNHLYGYRDSFGTVDVVDCYAASLVGNNTIMFFSYTGFPLVILDLEKRTEQIWNVPAEVKGADAISKSGDRVYFYGPYDDKAAIYEWHIGGKTAERIGEHRGIRRGLRGGRFLASGDAGYTVVAIK